MVTANTGDRQRHPRPEPRRRRHDRQRRGNPLGGAGAGNGNFTGQVYTIDKTAPDGQFGQSRGPRPTVATSVQWKVTFSESVTGVELTDFALVQGG